MTLRPRVNNPVMRVNDVRRRMWSESPVPKIGYRRVPTLGPTPEPETPEPVVPNYLRTVVDHTTSFAGIDTNTWSSTPTEGDMLLSIAVASGASAPTLTAPSGWTVLDSDTHTGADGVTTKYAVAAINSYAGTESRAWTISGDDDAYYQGAALLTFILSGGEGLEWQTPVVAEYTPGTSVDEFGNDVWGPTDVTWQSPGTWPLFAQFVVVGGAESHGLGSYDNLSLPTRFHHGGSAAAGLGVYPFADLDEMAGSSPNTGTVAWSGGQSLNSFRTQDPAPVAWSITVGAEAPA